MAVIGARTGGVEAEEEAKATEAGEKEPTKVEAFLFLSLGLALKRLFTAPEEEDKELAVTGSWADPLRPLDRQVIRLPGLLRGCDAAGGEEESPSVSLCCCCALEARPALPANPTCCTFLLRWCCPCLPGLSLLCWAAARTSGVGAGLWSIWRESLIRRRLRTSCPCADADVEADEVDETTVVAATSSNCCCSCEGEALAEAGRETLGEESSEANGEVGEAASMLAEVVGGRSRLDLVAAGTSRQRVTENRSEAEEG